MRSLCLFVSVRIRWLSADQLMLGTCRNLLTDSGGFQMVSLFDLAEITEVGACWLLLIMPNPCSACAWVGV